MGTENKRKAEAVDDWMVNYLKHSVIKIKQTYVTI